MLKVLSSVMNVSVHFTETIAFFNEHLTLTGDVAPATTEKFWTPSKRGWSQAAVFPSGEPAVIWYEPVGSSMALSRMSL